VLALAFVVLDVAQAAAPVLSAVHRLPVCPRKLHARSACPMCRDLAPGPAAACVRPPAVVRSRQRIPPPPSDPPPLSFAPSQAWAAVLARCDAPAHPGPSAPLSCWPHPIVPPRSTPCEYRCCCR